MFDFLSSPFFGNLSITLDGSGVYGHTLHYALVIAFVASAFIIFFYLWKKGRLDMDEEPKYRMMQDDNEKRGDKKDNDKS